MAVFFKGSRPGTHFWREENCPLRVGLSSHRAGGARLRGREQLDAIVKHITSYSDQSPFVSLTRSFAVAQRYALSTEKASQGKVWEIRLNPRAEERLINPVQCILQHEPRCYWHDGDPELVGRLAAPPESLHGGMGLPPQREFVCGETRQRANYVIPEELVAIVYALRDAELLATRIPKDAVRRAIPVG